MAPHFTKASNNPTHKVISPRPSTSRHNTGVPKETLFGLGKRLSVTPPPRQPQPGDCTYFSFYSKNPKKQTENG